MGYRKLVANRWFYHVGMELLRYTTDFGVYPEENEKDKCYCNTPNDCLKSGAFDLFKCTEADVVLSNVHFFRADNFYLNSVFGLDPD